MSFIENAKKLKKEKGYTTQELSKKCGIPLGTLSKLFSGIIEEPKLSAAIAISEALDTTVDSLCDLDNAAFTREEAEFLAKYRMLDTYGKNLADIIVRNELERMGNTMQSSENSFGASEQNEVIKTKPERKKKETATITPSPAEYAIKTLPLYNTPVSAGIGEFLEGNETSSIRVKNTGKVAEASFALKVSGDSMNPEYNDGDILIIKEQSSVDEGELGIFICDGQGYFKKFGGDRLISLNENYSDLMLSDFTQSTCVGLVLGRLKAKKS